MPSEYPIADMLVFPLKQHHGKLTLLSNRDHLLRRFGQLTLIDLASGEKREASVRAEADRFFFIIAGSATIDLIDLRDQSPSRGKHAEVNLSYEEPCGVLVPFGVACTVTAANSARLIELSTHSEDHPSDRTLADDELAQYIAAQ